jgi:hypothetical protein
MKNLILAAMMILFATTANAQKDVTKFLGIPVDGTKAEMIQKLKAKGFTSKAYDSEILEGEFNGEKVNIHIVTDNNKVYRIMVSDQATRDERQIIIRFNTLCRQFKQNSKYTSPDKDQTIPDTENIYLGINVRKKQYEASFSQVDLTDSTMMYSMGAKAAELLTQQFTEEELEAKSEEEIMFEIRKISEKLVIELLDSKSVWFTIHEYLGEYYISMYYDNNYNRANGEDL